MAVNPYIDSFGHTSPPQASLVGREEMATETDAEREARLKRFFSEGGTLSPEDILYLREREQETDEERATRLARVFADGGTLTPEDLIFLKGRGALRY